MPTVKKVAEAISARYAELFAAVLATNADNAESRVTEATTTVDAFTPEQVEKLDDLLAIGNPAKVAQAAYAASLNVAGKSFRGAVRQNRKVGVSKRATGCTRDEMDVTDLIWSVARYCK